MGRSKGILVWAAALPAMLVVLACNAGRPSEGVLEDLVRTSIGLDGDDPYAEMRDFRRVDGRDAGEGRYVAKVAYELEYLVGSKELSERLAGDLASSIEGEEPNGMGEQLGMMGGMLGLMALQLNPFEKGEVRQQERTVTLEHWESGWRLVE